MISQNRQNSHNLNQIQQTTQNIHSKFKDKQLNQEETDLLQSKLEKLNIKDPKEFSQKYKDMYDKYINSMK
ncbi:hypothetical protein HANVADRAFT_52016 [Hanseniaspora valbyensis NRRL Y-1626]|uniref:Uncharacterized protein n=1 Tax=Hanseniaspora valbyensis NRRL Y-1626 TaxID=766949 RepID=A0A1B7TGR6_9ASCO|nr:hypothetical protein HANVADRAFT_52016 [Hanseniaspora valbyensis NRRL Y-1626]